MDNRQRLNDREEALRLAMLGLQSKIWTAMPGIIDAFDVDTLTARVQIAIKGMVTGEDQVQRPQDLPVLVSVPVHFPRGGNCLLTFPVAPGDECLVVFASRCIDSWWTSGGVQVPQEARMHSLSDGFAFVGFFSQTTKVGVSTANAQLRSLDGSTYVELNPAAQKLRLVAPGGIELVAPTIELDGNLTQGTGSTKYPATLQGPITVINDLTAGGKSVSKHTHHENGAGSNTNPPN